MFCPYCGMEIEDNSKFCPFCGEHLDGAAAPAAPEQQPVRFDQTNTYQYRQEYTPENPYGSQPAPVQNEKPQKGGKKTLLWILLGAAAALLVAGGIILAIVLGGGTKKASGSHLLIRNENGVYYLDDEKNELFDKADEFYLAYDYSAVMTRYNGKWYHVTNGERTRIGGSNITMHKYDEKSLSWVLYSDKNGDISLFRAGKKDDIQILEASTIQTSFVSNNNKFLAICATEKKDYTIIRVNCSTGELATILEGRNYPTLFGVDDNGCVYYCESDRECHISDGKDDVTLEDINQVYVLNDLLLCSEVNYKKNTYTNYTRPLGMKGELKPLEDVFPKKLMEDTEALSIYPFGPYYGYRTGKNNGSLRMSSVIVEYQDDLYFVDLKAGTYVIMLADYSLSEIDGIRFTEDLKTAYIKAGSTLFKVTADKEEWQKETLSKHCSSLRSFRENGLIFEEDDGTVVVYDGREAVVFEDLAEYRYDFSDDLKSVVYVNDNKVMYIRKAGEKAERVAKDNGGSRAVLFKNEIYYINDDGDLLKMKPSSDPEVVMDDVAYISHDVY